MNQDQISDDFIALITKHGLCLTKENDLYRSHVVGWMWKAYQAGRAALLPVLQPEDQALLHEIAACLEADGAYMTADDVDMAVEIIRRILQQQAGTVLQSQHETQLQVWRSTDSCGEFWSWDEADQYDYDRAKPEYRRVVQIIKEG